MVSDEIAEAQKQSRLNLHCWLIEEDRKTEDSIGQITNITGTFYAEKDPTVNLLRGYLCAIRKAINYEGENR